MQEFKNEKEVLKELFDHYEENIVTYDVVMGNTGKKQQHRKLKDDSYDRELKEAIVKTFSENKGINEKINVKLKLGVPYNRAKSPWIQLYYMEKNAKGTDGRYTGISLNIESRMVEMWIRIWNDKNEKAKTSSNKRAIYSRI